MPLPAWAERTAPVAKVADVVAGLSTGRLRIAIDGLTGAGKTSFGHELAAALRDLGRATMRASMDDFKYPWRHPASTVMTGSAARGTTATPTTSAPPGTCCWPGGPVRIRRSRAVRARSADRCGPPGQEDQRPGGAILIVDSVFAFRPVQRLLGVPHLARGRPRDGTRRGVARDWMPRAAWKRPACTATATKRPR